MTLLASGINNRNMKKLIIIAAAAFGMFACNQGELDKSNQQNDSLVSVLKQREDELNKREETVNEFISSFNEVERNLDCVAVRQQIIILSADKGRGEIKGNQKEKINAQIKAINELMDSNRKTIAELRKKLKRSAGKNKKLEETIATLTDQLAQKDSELASLNEKLSSLNAQVAQLQTSLDTLNMVNYNQSQTIAANTAALHTAYYLIGKSKDLVEAKVIDKKGGLLGIGKTAKLNENFNREKFTQIDYTLVSTIPVNSEKVKIVTNHPGDSYRLDMDPSDKDLVKTLVITNPERFWSVSKYLVIQGNPVATENSMSVKGASKGNKY
jgi:predicted nuclease with TOPRIM domain